MDGQKCYLSTSRVKHAYYCNKGANKWSFMISWCIRVVFVGTNFLNRGLDQGFGIQFGKKIRSQLPTELRESRWVCLRIDSWEYTNFETLNSFPTLHRWVNFDEDRIPQP